MTKKPEQPQPRNAYEAAQELYGQLMTRLLKLEGTAAAVKELEALWELWEACIPDTEKKFDEPKI